ncbi:hypothetical protein, partial [Rhizobium leguminosarum]|uniref:hypothetical protein n=1 Tax=Rhizobium leguminosarum TaxID=384 RepID=UPI001C918D97
SRRRAAPEPPDIPSLLNSPQINATIESRHYGASKPSFSTQSANSRHCRHRKTVCSATLQNSGKQVSL